MDVPDSTGGDVRAERLEVINQCMRVQPVPAIVASAPGDVNPIRIPNKRGGVPWSWSDRPTAKCRNDLKRASVKLPCLMPANSSVSSVF